MIDDQFAPLSAKILTAVRTWSDKPIKFLVNTHWHGPFIDLNSGGGIEGYINAVKAGLLVVDAETKIIPGHGSVASKADYETFLTMLEEIKGNVEAQKP